MLVLKNAYTSARSRHDRAFLPTGIGSCIATHASPSSVGFGGQLAIETWTKSASAASELDTKERAAITEAGRRRRTRSLEGRDCTMERYLKIDVVGMMPEAFAFT